MNYQPIIAKHPELEEPHTGRRSAARFRSGAGGLLLLMLALGCLPVLRSAAQTGEPIQGPNRYLIAVETSRNMKARLPSIVTAVSNLFELSLQEQLRPGDSFGVWTFRTNLQTGEFPLQKWSSQARDQIRDNILRFIAARQFDKRADFIELQSGLERVVGSPALLTVFIVTSGEIPIRGTPFDDAINTTLKEWRQVEAERRQPMIIMLRGNKGRWTAHAVSAAPFPLNLPPLPKPPAPPPPAPRPLAEDHPRPETTVPEELAPERPAKVMPPLIISGKKENEPVPPETPAETTVTPAGTNAVPTATNALVSPPPPLRTTPVETPATNAVPATNAMMVQAGTNTVPTRTNALVPPPPPPRTIAPVPQTPAISTNRDATTAILAMTSAPPVNVAPAHGAVTSNEPAIPKPVAVAAATSSLGTVKSPEPTPTPSPITVVEPPNTSVTSHVVTVSSKVPPMATNTVGEAVAIAPATETTKEQKAPVRNNALLLAALGVSLLAIGVVYVLRRSRKTQHPSLITRSLEKPDGRDK